MNVYLQGQHLRLEAEWRNLSGVLTNPSSQTLTIIPPTGDPEVVTQASLQTTGAGLFYYDLELDQPYVWTWSWEAAGDVEAVIDGQCYVRPTAGSA